MATKPNVSDKCLSELLALIVPLVKNGVDPLMVVNTWIHAAHLEIVYEDKRGRHDAVAKMLENHAVDEASATDLQHLLENKDFWPVIKKRMKSYVDFLGDQSMDRICDMVKSLVKAGENERDAVNEWLQAKRTGFVPLQLSKRFDGPKLKEFISLVEGIHLKVVEALATGTFSMGDLPTTVDPATKFAISFDTVGEVEGTHNFCLPVGETKYYLVAQGDALWHCLGIREEGWHKITSNTNGYSISRRRGIPC